MAEKILYAIGGGIIGFLAPIQTFLICLLVFIGADLISGVMAAKKRGELLESKKLRATITKTTFYFIFIILAHILWHYVMGYTDLKLQRSVSFLLCGVELYSVLENAYCITQHRVFWLLTQFTVKKIKEITDCDITEKKEE